MSAESVDLCKSIAVCCSVLQCVAVCCSVLQRVAAYSLQEYCSVLQRIAAHCSVLQRMTAWCSVAACCSVLQCVSPTFRTISKCTDHFGRSLLLYKRLFGHFQKNLYKFKLGETCQMSKETYINQRVSIALYTSFLTFLPVDLYRSLLTFGMSLLI